VDLDIENSIYRIISGFYYIEIDGTRYKILVPTKDILYRAHRLYLSVIDELKFDSGWLPKTSIDNMLLLYNIWNKAREEELVTLNKILDGAKIQLYLKYGMPKLKKENKKIIQQTKEKIHRLYEQKSYFNCLSLEDYANSVKNQYIIIYTVYKEDELFFKEDWTTINSIFLDKVLAEMHRNYLSVDDIKRIAGHPLWRSYWDASKDNVFGKHASELTEEQRLLITFSKNYDNIREHPESPSQEILDDTDALDGWMLYQHDKIEKEKKRKDIETRFGLDKKDKGGIQEVFIPVSSNEEAADVHSLNDPIAETNRKHMMEFVKEDEAVDWAKLPHIKREIQLQQQQAIKGRNKL
jgi:hypothetical protein